MKQTHGPGKVFSFVDVFGKVGESEAMFGIPVILGGFIYINLYGSWSKILIFPHCLVTDRDGDQFPFHRGLYCFLCGVHTSTVGG